MHGWKHTSVFPYSQLVVPVRRQLQRDDDLVTERRRLLVPEQLVDGVQLPGHQGEVVQDRRPVVRIRLDVCLVLLQGQQAREWDSVNEVVPGQSLEFIFQLVDEVVESVFEMSDARDQQIHGRLQLLLLSLLSGSTFKTYLNGKVQPNLYITS